MQDQILNAPDHNMLASCPSVLQDRRLIKQHVDQVLKCPRCDSLNTKFCYYNNYSLTQPRHFCKNCKRYWTKGGALRNVPVGGGCRKNKRTKQRTIDQGSSSPGAAAGAAHTEEAALLSAACNLTRVNGSSLQHDNFSGATCSSGRSFYNEGDGMGLTFERLHDPVTRSFSAASAPLSQHKWEAPQLSAPPAGSHSMLHSSLQPFNSNVLALNLSGHLKQAAVGNDRLQTSDLNAMQALEHQFNMITGVGPVRSSALISDTFNPPHTFFHDSYGNPSGNGDHLEWRMPPKLVTTVEEAGHTAAPANYGSTLQQLLRHSHAAAENHPGCKGSLRHEIMNIGRTAKGKLPIECNMPISSELDEPGNQPSPTTHDNWQTGPSASAAAADHAEAGLFELTGDPVCNWNQSGNYPWPQEYLTTYHGVTGSQLL